MLELVDLTVRSDSVDVTVSGPAAPPRAPNLSDEVADAVGADVVLSLRWIPSFDPGLGGEPPADRLARYVTAWIGDRSSVRLIATSIDGATLLIDLGAEGTPAGLDVLERVARSAVDGAERVEVRLLPLEGRPDHPRHHRAPPTSTEVGRPRSSRVRPEVNRMVHFGSDPR